MRFNSSTIINGEFGKLGDVVETTFAGGIASVATLGAANDALYLSERVVGIVGSIPEEFQLTVKGHQEFIPLKSYGNRPHDTSPFAFVGNIDDSFTYLKEGLYALDYMCHVVGAELDLSREEVRQVLIDNAVVYIEQEIERISFKLDELDELDDDENSKDKEILMSYISRLEGLNGRFKGARVEAVEQYTKGGAEKVLDAA